MKNKIIWTSIAASAAALFVFFRRKGRKAAMKTQLPVNAGQPTLKKAYARTSSMRQSGQTNGS